MTRRVKWHAPLSTKYTALAITITLAMVPSAYVFSKSILNVVTTDSTIIEQGSCPIQLKICNCEAVEDDSIDELYGVLHGVMFRNETTKLVTAVRLKFVSVNALDEVIGTHDGWYVSVLTSVLPQISAPLEGVENAIWLQSASSGFAFQHGFVYVDKVAFSDGSVWTRSLNSILGFFKAKGISVDSNTLTAYTTATPPLKREYLSSFNLDEDEFVRGN